jgi:hypothetical protein
MIVMVEVDNMLWWIDFLGTLDSAYRVLSCASLTNISRYAIKEPREP